MYCGFFMPFLEGVIFALILMHYIDRKVRVPAEKLAEANREVAAGNLDYRLELKDSGSREFENLFRTETDFTSGDGLDEKKYRYHTGYIGGLKEIGYRELMTKNPEKAVLLAVKGMLPKNSIGRKSITRLKVYRGAEHPHTAQQPKTVEF